MRCYAPTVAEPRINLPYLGTPMFTGRVKALLSNSSIY